MFVKNGCVSHLTSSHSETVIFTGRLSSRAVTAARTWHIWSHCIHSQGYRVWWQLVLGFCEGWQGVGMWFWTRAHGMVVPTLRISHTQGVSPPPLSESRSSLIKSNFWVLLHTGCCFSCQVPDTWWNLGSFDPWMILDPVKLTTSIAVTVTKDRSLIGWVTPSP